MFAEIVKWSMRGNLEKVDPKAIKKEIMTAAGSASLHPQTDLKEWSDKLKIQFMDINEDGEGNMRHFGFEVQNWNCLWALADSYSPLVGDDARDKYFGCFIAIEKEFPVNGRCGLIIDFSGTYEWGNNET